jgi:hypothetical protein
MSAIASSAGSDFSSRRINSGIRLAAAQLIMNSLKFVYPATSYGNNFHDKPARSQSRSIDAMCVLCQNIRHALVWQEPKHLFGQSMASWRMLQDAAHRMAGYKGTCLYCVNRSVTPWSWRNILLRFVTHYVFKLFPCIDDFHIHRHLVSIPYVQTYTYIYIRKFV